MHPTLYARRTVFCGALLLAGLLAGLGQAHQPPLPQPAPTGPIAPAEVKVDKSGTLLVPVGGTVQWTPVLPDFPTDYLESRADVLQFKIDPSKRGSFFLTGKMTGVAQITFTFKNSPKMTFDVLVQPDLDLLRTIIRRTIPTAAVDVQPGLLNGSIILSGYVTSPQDADILMRLAGTAASNPNAIINAVQVGGVQQVQIDVVVASVDRSLARFRGFDVAVGGQTVNFESIVSGLITSSLGQSSGGGTGGGFTAPLITTAANLQTGIVPAQFYAALQALRSEGIAKFLAEPKVVTQSGRPAFFLAGGQQAIISGTAGITGPGVSLVPFGTQLDVLPIVYGNGQIWLEINPKITAVSTALGITVGSSVSPGFTQQEVRSAVMLESGQTFAIGGLIQNTVQATANKVPVLGDLPYLGIAFSSVTHTQTESELVIMVTPRLVGPMNCDQVPRRLPGRETRNPDDYELFLENILEAPRGQRKVCNGCCYNAAYKCGPTAAIFPCVGGVCNGRPGAGLAAGGYPVPAAPGGAPVQGFPTPPPAPPVPGAPISLPPLAPGTGDRGPAGGENGLAPVITLPDVSRN